MIFKILPDSTLSVFQANNLHKMMNFFLKPTKKFTSRKPFAETYSVWNPQI